MNESQKYKVQGEKRIREQCFIITFIMFNPSKTKLAVHRHVDL